MMILTLNDDIDTEWWYWHWMMILTMGDDIDTEWWY